MDSWHLLVRNGGRVFADHLHGSYLALLAGTGHSPQMLSRDYIYWLLQVQRVQSAAVQSAQLVSSKCLALSTL